MKEYLFLGGPYNGQWLVTTGTDRIPYCPPVEPITVPLESRIPPEPIPLQYYCKDYIWIATVRYTVYVFYNADRNIAMLNFAVKEICKKEQAHARRT